MMKKLFAALIFSIITICALTIFVSAEGYSINSEQLEFMAKTSPYAKIINEKYDSYSDFVEKEEALVIEMSSPAEGCILYSDGDISFDVVLNDAAKRKGEKISLSIIDKESGSEIVSPKAFYINSDMSVSIYEIVNSYFDNEIDETKLNQGIVLAAKATLIGMDGNELASTDYKQFIVASAGFNVTEGDDGFSLAGLGRDAEHTDCYTACSTHSRILTWNSFDDAECLITLKRGSSKVFNGTVSGNPFDVSKYYLADSPDTEYVLTAKVRNKGDSSFDDVNTISYRFVLCEHPSRPVISSVSCDYARAIFTISDLDNTYDAKISIKSNGELIYNDYMGQVLPKGSYTATAVLRRFPCAGISKDFSFKVTAAQEETGRVLRQTVTMISSREGTYNTVDRVDGNSMSIGKICWHGTNAQLLLQRIKLANPGELKANLEGTVLYEDIAKPKSHWSTRICSVEEKPILQKAISSDTAKLVQDAYADEFIYNYVEYGKNKKGITNPGALMFYCDLCIQGGNGGGNRVANAVSGEITLYKIYQASLVDRVFKNYQSRRTAIYNYIKDLGYTK